MSDPTRPMAHGLPRGVVVLITLAAVVIVVAGVRSVAGIAGPVFLAVVFTIGAQPVRNFLVGHGAPRWLASVATIIAIYVVLLSMTVAIIVSGARLAAIIPEYEDQFADLIDSVTDLLARIGIGQDRIDEFVASFDLNRIAGWATQLLGSTLGVLTSLFFVVTLIIFLVTDASWFVPRTQELPPARAAFVAAMSSFARNTRRYIWVSTVFGLIVAVFDAIGLLILGIPGAVLWGLLAFITNYIPNIGFVLGLIPPVVLALLEGGWGLAIAVIVLYSVINVVIQTIIQPRLMGNAVGMSATVTMISLVFWTFVIGPLGAVLAVPLSLLAKSLLVDADPDARWLQSLIAEQPDDAR